MDNPGVSQGKSNTMGLKLDTDSFLIIYMVVIYPLIPISVSLIAILWMSVPIIIKILVCSSQGLSVRINKKMLPLMIIPILAALSGGTTAVAYGGKIGITILGIALLGNETEKNYCTFLNVVRLNGIIVLITMYFEFLFRDIAIHLYTPIWNLYLHGEELSLLQSTINARNGLCYGIIPNASYAVNALTFALGTYLTDLHNKKNKIMTLLLYIGIFMTSKRSYMIFVTITILALKFLIGGKRNRENRLLGGMLLVFLALGVWIIIEPYIEYSSTGIGKLLATIKYFNDPVYIEQYFIRAERDVLSEYAIQLFKENWAFGVGWGNFSKLYLQDTGIWRIDAHTTYLQILCESGIFASIIIFGLLWREFSHSLRCLKRDRKQYYYMAYVITFCALISFTAFIFDMTQFYVALFLCIYFMRNININFPSSFSLKQSNVE